MTEEQEELPSKGAVTHMHRTHTRSQSHIQIHPLTHTTQRQAPRALAHTRSHSHNHFSTPSHTQTQKYGCRLTHSLSAMTKGEKAAQGSVGKLIKPTEPLFPKTPQQVRSFVCLFVCFWYCCEPCLDSCCESQALNQSEILNVVWCVCGSVWLRVASHDWMKRGKKDGKCDLSISLRLIDCIVFPVNCKPPDSRLNAWKLTVFI